MYNRKEVWIGLSKEEIRNYSSGVETHRKTHEYLLQDLFYAALLPIL